APDGGRVAIRQDRSLRKTSRGVVGNGRISGVTALGEGVDGDDLGERRGAGRVVAARLSGGIVRELGDVAAEDIGVADRQDDATARVVTHDDDVPAGAEDTGGVRAAVRPG